MANGIKIELTTFNSYHQIPSEEDHDSSSLKIVKVFNAISERIQQKAAEVTSDVKKKIDWIYEDFRIPGSTGITAPVDACFYISGYIRASAFHDKEAQYDLLIRLSALPLGFIYSIVYILSGISKIGAFFDWTRDLTGIARALGQCLNILGLIFTGLETIFESYNFYKDGKFLVSLKPFRNNLETTKEVLTTLYQDYFQLNEEEVAVLSNLCHKIANSSEEKKCIMQGIQWMEMKKAELIHRVHPWAAERIERELTPLLLERLSDPEDQDAHTIAANLLKIIRQQSWKKVVVHVLGLLTLGIQGVSYSLMLLGVPFSILFFGLFFLCYFSRYFIMRGTFDQEGWRFSAADCIPGFIKTLRAKITHSKEDTSKSLQGCLAEGTHPDTSDPQEKDHHRKVATDPLFSQSSDRLPFAANLEKLA